MGRPGTKGPALPAKLGVLKCCDQSSKSALNCALKFGCNKITARALPDFKSSSVHGKTMDRSTPIPVLPSPTAIEPSAPPDAAPSYRYHPCTGFRRVMHGFLSFGRISAHLHRVFSRRSLAVIISAILVCSSSEGRARLGRARILSRSGELPTGERPKAFFLRKSALLCPSSIPKEEKRDERLGIGAQSSSSKKDTGYPLRVAVKIRPALSSLSPQSMARV